MATGHNITYGDHDGERQSQICCGCGKAKDIGLVVCWPCFKYRTDVTPFRYFVEQQRGDLPEWLAYVRATKAGYRPSFSETDCSGAFDGYSVTSDADPGL